MSGSLERDVDDLKEVFGAEEAENETVRIDPPDY